MCYKRAKTITKGKLIAEVKQTEIATIKFKNA